MKSISLKLPEPLHSRLEAEARRRRTSKSEVVRQCVEKTLTGPRKPGKPSCFDLVSDMAGCVKGGPADLASNPKYLEGFGT